MFKFSNTETQCTETEFQTNIATFSIEPLHSGGHTREHMHTHTLKSLPRGYTIYIYENQWFCGPAPSWIWTDLDAQSVTSVTSRLRTGHCTAFGWNTWKPLVSCPVYWVHGACWLKSSVRKMQEKWPEHGKRCNTVGVTQWRRHNETSLCTPLHTSLATVLRCFGRQELGCQFSWKRMETSAERTGCQSSRQWGVPCKDL